ncbi:phosphoribosylaminoimidazole carboxylase ATPase subunit [Vibrio ponticus]|nr:phosphoribosylaminoimidazole carboxylase ATPase subunit [Vibrio ponticus]
MHVLVLGSGQLARMMSLAGAPLNIELTAYDVSNGNIVHPLTQTVLGSGLDNAIAHADVITAEFEHIPHHILDLCEQSGKFLPSPGASRPVAIAESKKLSWIMQAYVMPSMR